MHMLHHLSFAVVDLTRSATFYDAALAPLGYVRVWADETAVGYGSPGGDDKFAIKLKRGVVVPGEGFHVAFAASSREAVTAFHRAVLQHGGQDIGWHRRNLVMRRGRHADGRCGRETAPATLATASIVLSFNIVILLFLFNY